MHFKKLPITLFLTLISSFVIAQEEQDVKNMPFGQRLIYGGDFGLSFGTNTYINISPYVGYRITNRLSAGLGPIYIYEKYKYYDLRTSTYGGKALMSFTVIKDIGQYLNIGIGNIIFHTENEVISIEKLYYNVATMKYYNTEERIWIDNWLIGGGLNQPFGMRGGINIFILWDVTQNDYSPHSNPIVRLGFYF
ncbi:MAG: hypothetical protein JXR41_02860 [Bacteroidales bacterium]|nr:hypothetical protein [Bacteroidales bacterium]MBN2762006.1 hypothetical protein [Bacteroidales bacterium]